MDKGTYLRIKVVIPCIDKDEELARKTAEFLKVRAGYPCDIEVVKDKERIGWVAMHNKIFEKLEGYDYYVYGCSDYYPGRLWLAKAVKEMKNSPRKKLFAFNDGKWFGDIATVGLINVKWGKKNYEGGSLFYPGYKSHYADTELSYIAWKFGVMCYHPEAMLVEVDLEKHKIGQNVNDYKTWIKRRENNEIFGNGGQQ